MGQSELDKGDQPKRSVFARHGRLSILLLVVIHGAGFSFSKSNAIGSRNTDTAPANMSQAPAAGPGEAASPSPSQALQPPAPSPSLATVLKTPDDYLNLMSSDPSTLPPPKRPVAVALNKLLEGMKNADDEERSAEKEFQTRALDTIQSPKDKEHLESAKTFATDLKAISEKQGTYYKGIQAALANDLKAAGAPDEMVSQVSTLFVQRSGVESGISRAAAVEKVANDILEIMSQLQKNNSKWKTRADGKMTFTDREVMNNFNALILALNVDMKNVQPPITAL
jgi:hypothetical protein